MFIRAIFEYLLHQEQIHAERTPIKNNEFQHSLYLRIHHIKSKREKGWKIYYKIIILEGIKREGMGFDDKA